jgi:hypothetical protein
VCLVIDYTNTTGDISTWYYGPEFNIQIPTSANGNYDSNTQTLTDVVFENTTTPFLNNIFGTYNTNDITKYAINDNLVTINGTNITATLSFSEDPCCFSQ